MTTVALQADAPPLRLDESGALRVGNSRVLLDLVIQAFNDGASPETIVQQYSSTNLSDVYAVIAYYLRHREQIDLYLAERDQEADKVRERIEAHQGDLSEIRKRLLAQKKR